ncbi:outer membrane protein assembly factor BamD [Helicobacter sp. MIT 11-5569]|uniref:outer membrane protein assembly factor BamD n=1 Tax=Helicobacter sp. MIT 11-5569 TaxID=1548151 RepID=UPI00068B9397|nr:outer membrane protein assembly factor BamD [Helicobacter sp. MIT 11-5569]
MMKFSFLSLCLVLLFGACSSKTNSGLALDEVNKPADYWYQNMLKEIRNGDLEKADSYFVSLQSEHLNSPLLSEAMLILGRAHMQEEEYMLAGFYFDEFTKRFGSPENIDFIRFLKLQANYFAFSKQFRDQQLLLDSIRDAKEFTKQYPYSRYRPMVDSMLLRLELSNLTLNEEIAQLYERKKKGSGAEYYLEKTQEVQWLKDVLRNDVESPWYQKLFEW